MDVLWGIGCIFASPDHHPVVGYMKQKRLSSDQWILRHVPKRVRRCRSANSGRLMTLLDFCLADLRRFLTVLVDIRLLGSQCCLNTGLVANGIRLTKRCNALSSRSDITRGLPDLAKSFTLLVCVYFLTNRLTTV
jgi:hypothetical protein